ncbi:polysulfide reductase [Malaciobacter halophilus]|uniref:Polysulfide reductase n=1 Tax=Malaciobacter halophilus TaxID=197482 RepID=A0A2N1J5B7_9BACT|nr:NrfD/PsrC family molybdoenzyme membrane anchor subunit [Malaciobacter halophilus]AXH10728.1 putative thiosulfate/polysulfide reductase, membrane-anchoring subunit [Malaciobacter halophilus]PKI81751.1 polysulfide reductase [Malaciobacter halophilus]
MNNMWGSTAQYEVINWPWPIAVYLFLAGLSAGSIIIALLVKWNRHEKDSSSIWDAMIKAGAIISPLTICVGLLLLIVDLGKPLSFYWLLISYNFTSVMTLGVIALFIYTPLAFVFMGLIFEDTIKQNKLLSMFSPIISYIKSFEVYAKRIEYVLFGLALVVGAYTGFLLSANMTYPMWNSPVLPILFLASGISAGIAGNILVGMIFFKSSINKESIKYLLILDLRVILLEIPLLIILFVGMLYAGGSAEVAAIQALTVGKWASIFWFGVIGLGLVSPLLIAFTALRNHAYKVGFILINSMIVLAGVILLRFYVVYAGQLFTGA